MSRLCVRSGWLAAVAVAVAAAGCGTERPTTVVNDRTLRLRMEEYRFVPQKIRARRGALTIRAYDAGILPHNLAVFRKGFEVARIKTIQHGESAVLRVRLRPGTYRLECTVQNHDDLGMYGALVVR